MKVYAALDQAALARDNCAKTGNKEYYRGLPERPGRSEPDVLRVLLLDGSPISQH